MAKLCGPANGQVSGPGSAGIAAALPAHNGPGLGRDGKLAPRRGAADLRFTFVHDDLEFRAVLRGSGAWLELTAELGPLPYSAQSPAARQLCRKVIQASRRPGRPGRLRLRGDQGMLFEAATEPPAPGDAASVIAAATALLLDIKPYLALLATALDMVGQPLPRPVEREGWAAAAGSARSGSSAPPRSGAAASTRASKAWDVDAGPGVEMGGQPIETRAQPSRGGTTKTWPG